MEIRHSTFSDVEAMMEIFAIARSFMTSQGNPSQWGPRNWPPRELIEEDIAQGKSYVVVDDGRVVGTFFMDYGDAPEPTYFHIEGQGWNKDEPYAVIHRIASNQKTKGVGEAAIAYAFSFVKNVRIDTHEDNVPMRNLLAKLGFSYRGIIYVDHGTSPRLAYERNAE